MRLGRQRSPERQGGDFPTKYLRAANVGEDGLDLTDVLEMDFTPAEREIYALRNGDVLLAEGSGSASHVGRAALWRDELPLCCFQNTLIRFRAHAALPEYALVVFQHYARNGLFADTARGIGVLHLGSRRFSNLPFPLPPLPEQRRIVAEVERRNGELRSAEAALQSALERSRQQDVEILSAAVAGELVQTEPEGSQVILHHDETGAALSDVVSPPHVPRHWRWTTLETVGDLMLGKALARSRQRGAQMCPYLRVANIREDEIDFSDLKQMPFTESDLERYTLVPGDILITEASGSPAQLGRPAMYRGEVPGVGFQNHLMRFRAGDQVDAAFALIVFRHYFHAGLFRPFARGSTSLANLSRSRLATMPFPVPPIHEQREIAAEANRRLEGSKAQRAAILSSLERLSEITTELLGAATTGTLVEQDGSEEPAAELLRRLGPVPPDAEPGKVAEMTSPQEASPTGSRASDEVPPTPAERIMGVLEHAAAPLALPDLCRAADIDLNDVAEIEALYLTLRTGLGRSIRVVGKAEENATIEAVRHAT